jgi:hypothetical protein
MSASAKPGARRPVVANRYIAADKIPVSAELIAIAASMKTMSKKNPSTGEITVANRQTATMGIVHTAIASDSTDVAVSWVP